MTTVSLRLHELLVQYAELSETGIAVFDTCNRFIFYNKACARLFGFEDHSMLGQSHQDLMRHMYVNQRGAKIDWPSLDAWLAHTKERFRSVPQRSFEVDLHDGRWFLVSEQACPGGELVMLCADITRQKQTEQALRQVQEELARLALTDELTGLPNRRSFIQRLEQEFAQSRRHGRPLAVAMLDLDHFKKVNDQYGHAAGDVVLRHFGQHLRQQLRTGDVVGRLGGEEFGVLLPDIGLPDAVHLLVRIQEGLDATGLDDVCAGFSYSFSAGLVQCLGAEVCDSDGLLLLADAALYAAKAAGRRRVVVHEPSRI